MTYRGLDTSEELIAGIFKELENPVNSSIRAVVFDLASVTMIDSHWLGMFVRASKQVQPMGLAIILRHPQATVRRLLDLVQFDRIFQIEA
jgi:anti-anti-sigma factor